MKTAAAIKHYETVEALAAVLGITTNAVYQWGDKVPRLRALEIEKETDGKLKAQNVRSKK